MKTSMVLFSFVFLISVVSCRQSKAPSSPDFGNHVKPDSVDSDDELKKFIEEQRTVLAEMRAENEKLEKQKTDLEGKAKDLEVQIGELKSTLATNSALSSSEKSQLENQMNALMNEKAAVDKKVQDLNARILDLEKKNSTLQSQMDAIMRENVRLQRELAEAKAAANAAQSGAVGQMPSNATVTKPSGYAFRITEGGRNDCLDIPLSKEAGVQLTAYPCHYQANQLFELIGIENQFFQIRSVYSGMCLTIPDANNRRPILQEPCITPIHLRQSWEFDTRGSSPFRLKNRARLCLGVETDKKVYQTNCEPLATSLIKSSMFIWTKVGP